MTDNFNPFLEDELANLKEQNAALEQMVRESERREQVYFRLYSHISKWMVEINEDGDIVPMQLDPNQRLEKLEEFIIHGSNFMEMTSMIHKNQTVGDAFKKFMVALRMAGYDEHQTDH